MNIEFDCFEALLVPSLAKNFYWSGQKNLMSALIKQLRINAKYAKIVDITYQWSLIAHKDSKRTIQAKIVGIWSPWLLINEKEASIKQYSEFLYNL